MDSVDGLSLTVGGTALTAIGGVVGAWIKAHYGQKKTVTPEPNPFPITQQGPFVTVGECKQHRCAIQQNIDRTLDMQKAILGRIDVLDEKAEKRSVDLHRRLDPFVESLAETRGRVEMLQEMQQKGKK